MLSQSAITEVNQPLRRGPEIFLSWTSTAPTGSRHQVYLNGELAWTGQQRSCWLTAPSGPTRIDVGAVVSGFGGDGFGEFGFATATGMEESDFSADLPVAPGRRAKLAWQGGTYAGLTLAGYRVYGESSPGAGIDYTAPLVTITAYPAGITTDGWGLGEFGRGTFGYTAGSYSWTSEPLAAGAWQFAVKSFDSAGNEGTAQVSTATIAAPPRAPAALSYSLSGFGVGGFGGGLGFGNGTFGSGSFGGGSAFGSPVVTLGWQAAA